MPTLVTIDTAGHQLDAPAAASYARMTADGCPPGVTSAYRPPQEGVALFLERYTTDYAASSRAERRVWPGHGTYWRKKGVTIPVAVPGTSEHEDGKALDLPTGGPREWVAAHPDYGWLFDVAGDPPHTTYHADRDQHAADPAPQTPTTTPMVVDPADPAMLWEDIDDMKALIIACYGTFFGRVPSDAETDWWLTAAAQNGWTGKDVVDKFLGSKAEAGTVRQAYLSKLHRLPESNEAVAGWSDGELVSEVFAGVAASKEAQLLAGAL
ncbi:MAG: hypothetical protein L6311_16560 [Cellulomonas sp.]|nr:hypothetical protein [Cellulomonas sp.]